MNTYTLRRFLGFFLVSTLVVFSASTTVSADTRRADSVVIEANEIINEDLFIGGGDVRILGEVNGDVYIGAEDVRIDGIINGDLFIAAETITVTGVLNDDIRVLGKTLTLTGATLNDGVTFLGAELNLDADTVVTGTALFLGDTFVMDGLINGNIRGGADTFIVSGEVTDSLYIATRVLHLEETASVVGDVYYTSDIEAILDPGATIGGDMNWERIEIPEWRNAMSVWTAVFFTLFSFLSALITGIVLLLIFYRPVTLISERIRERPLISLGTGALVIPATISLLVLSLLTIIGIPFGLLSLTLFVVAVYLSEIFVALALGHFVLGALRPAATVAPSAYLSFVLGLTLLYLLYQVPFLGPLVAIVVVLMGLGGFVYGVRRIRNRS